MDFSFLKSRFVEVFYRGKLTPAFVKDVKDKRLRIILPSGKEELLSHSALAFYSEKSSNIKDLNQIIDLLKSQNEVREREKDEINLKEIWEALVEEVEEISAYEAAELVFLEKIDDDKVAGLIRKVVEDKTYFKLKAPNLLLVNSKKEVERLLIQKQKEIERLKKLNEGETFVTALKQGKSIEEFSEEIKSFWLEALKNFVLWQEEAPNGKLVSEVLKRVGLNDPFKLFCLLVQRGILQEDENLDLLRLRFPQKFSEKALSEVPLVIEKVQKDDVLRTDYSHLDTYTIDAEETQDFDDALSFEKKDQDFIFYIHIAEVANFVSPGSKLWEEALERASTLYLPDGILPMLPFELSHEVFSLRENEVKPAITFKITLSKNAEVKDFKIELSKIKVKKRLTYNEVDESLKNKDEFWTEVYDLFMKVKEKREKQGEAVYVMLPEVCVRLENGEIKVEKLEMTPARLLIAEAMILTNFLVAKYFFENSIPALYRSQPKPSEVIEEREKSLFHKLMQLKYLTKSELSTQPDFHAGLGLNYYTTVTSPIRRFLDLLMQYQLKCHLIGKKGFDEEELKKLLPEITENIQRASFLQAKRVKYFLLKYLKLYKKGEPLKGLVLSVQNKKAKVYLIDYNLTGEMMLPSQNISPGEEITVTIEKVNPHQEVLRLKSI
ncbi:MAG: RNB domain-containing ribonuclease [Thermodesulfobacteria bacterium]|nr:RNB domain-containing ribonuclease [Thermodesulfobacteriota bacterium]